MQRTMENFIRALRAQDIRVSPAEAIDAHRAAEAVGYADRELFRDALVTTLAKTAHEAQTFDSVFETFFRRDEFTKTPEEDADKALAEELPEGDGQGDLAHMLLEHDDAALAQAMEAAAERAGVSEIRLSSQRRLLTRRMLDEMGLGGLEQRIANAGRREDEKGKQLAERLAKVREALFAEAGRYVERQHDLYAAESGRKLREDVLSNQKLTAIDEHELATMQRLVRRMAKNLASKYSRHIRRAKRGQLDVRRTIRKSLGHGGLPFDLIWKSKTIDRPSIAVMCDVSGSVAQAAHFLLLFLYSLNEVVERLDAFAFSNRLVPVGDILNDEAVADAIAMVIKRIGMRSTDYGLALEDFCALELAKIDNKTTVIILGDGRTNYVNPRLDLMRAISERARAVIWLNPEPESLWTRGDSEMERYKRFCTVAKTCSTLAELERIIEDVLRTYMPR
ncbi:MAG TPA: VWA domain-containing protein [Caulobacteraceae bacterium]|nr:VWA domain-containing protein [Caulobacteraceae bacterium]